MNIKKKMRINGIDRQSLQTMLKHPTLRFIIALQGMIVLIGVILGIMLKV